VGRVSFVTVGEIAIKFLWMHISVVTAPANYSIIEKVQDALSEQ
jgi:hypothetical protein